MQNEVGEEGNSRDEAIRNQEACVVERKANEERFRLLMLEMEDKRRSKSSRNFATPASMLSGYGAVVPSYLGDMLIDKIRRTESLSTQT